jgi:hypothetical protein
LLKLFAQSTFNHSGRELVDLAKFGALIQSQAPRLNQYKYKCDMCSKYKFGKKKHYLLCGEQTGGLLLLLLHKVAELGSRAEPVHHRLHLN